MEWLGRIHTRKAPWIYHEQLSWVYALDGTGDNLSFWDPALVWLWTAKGWFPYLYAYATGDWYYFFAGPGPRWFFNLNKGEWEVS